MSATNIYPNYLASYDAIGNFIPMTLNALMSMESGVQQANGGLPEDSAAILEINNFINELYGKKIFIDAAGEEDGVVQRFKAILSGSEAGLNKSFGLLKEEIVKNDDPTESFAQLRKSLNECDVVITFYRATPASWLDQRLNLYRIIQAKRKNSLKIYIISQQTQPPSLKMPPNTKWINGNISDYLGS